MNITPIVKQLLIVNILFFIGSYFVPVSYDFFSLYYPESEKFKVWQLITHMFMHAPFPNVTHIFFNMFALYSFGSTLEHFWGGKKFLFFYISCGLGAALINTSVNYYFFHDGLNFLMNQGFSKAEILSVLNGKSNNEIISMLNGPDFKNFTSAYFGTVVGASGAIYGLLVAFAFMFPNAELALMFVPVPIKAKYFVPIFMLLYDGFFGILGNSFMGVGDGVAHFAHLGGALFGFLIMWYWKKNQFNSNRWN
jgi:membrane associated rhomboid family serine protease